MKKILINDRLYERRKSLKLLVNLDLYFKCEGDYSNYQNLSVQKTSYDTALMNMPAGLSSEAINMNSNLLETLVIMHTVDDSEHNILNGILYDTDGLTSKIASPEQIVTVIYEPSEGGFPITPNIIRRILDMFGNNCPGQPEKDFNLSDREIEVFNCLLQGSSQKMIAAKLDISKYTVNNHIKKIYQKLQVHSVSEAILTVIQKRVI